MVVTSIINTLAFPIGNPNPVLARELEEHRSLIWLRTNDGHKIPALYIRSPRPRRATRFLVLYSHGNAEDLTEMPLFVADLASAADVDVLAYDYVGYGISSGSPSEQGLYASADAAYAWATRGHEEGGAGWSPSLVVPFGRSLGSAPAVHLAHTASTPCGGLLLMSPLMSGAHALFGKGTALAFGCIDPFKNYSKIQKARCTVGIVHGTADEVVPCSNGRALARLCRHGLHEPLWCEGKGHNDMNEREVFEYARGFLDSLDERLAAEQ